MDDPQRTIAAPCRFSGIALHTGGRAHLTIQPAAADAGVSIIRVDLPDQPSVKAVASNVVDVRRATTLASGDAVVYTVEHVLAALYAGDIDNAVIEMDGPEPPIVDGSSAPFFTEISAAGTVTQEAPRQYCCIEEAIYVEQGETRAVILPYDEYRISCTIGFGATIMDTQYLSLPVTSGSFATELAGARTFCPYEQIEELMVAGLVRGGSLDNAVVIKDGVIIAKDELRFPDEFVRHKVLDIVGDLSLVGRRLRGQIIAIKPGHPSNVALAQRIREVMGYEHK
ncbi:MAG: UDP-3-O-acyl-N-acetylglucosamine deacetylase [Lentisphaeria bacterium]|nr:UDP-3-O-acyl-N-acetylglucosamine deacetylase [Lentisphaeria bacterium]MDP7741909.1 UDP-3-O-acyl-N-acetylglucosamine deacetylase [Lentisphaeria bacterium]